jgi:hypothetical protein
MDRRRLDIVQGEKPFDNPLCKNLGAMPIGVNSGDNVGWVLLFKRADNASLSKGEDRESDFFFSHGKPFRVRE